MTEPASRLSTSALVILVVLAVHCLPHPVNGQQHVRSVLSHVPSDARLEITAPGLWLSDVTLHEVGTDTVVVSNHGAVVPVAFDEIETLAVRRGRGWLGAAMGGGAGLLAGGVFGLMIKSFGCRSPGACETSDRRGATIGGLAGAAVGAAIGYWLGSRSVRWQPIFPEP